MTSRGSEAGSAFPASASRAVLGIDAAWTGTQPSGVALAVERQGRWRLAAVAPSYGLFASRAEAGLRAEQRPTGSAPDASALLLAARVIGGRPVDLVAVDMPLARTPISGRRPADDAVSRSYGARKCSTHSPSALRPGRISDDLRAGFEAQGYGLCTDAIVTPGLMEVYPHPALIELAGSSERLPYKAGKASSYWPSASPSERRNRLLRQWRAIILLLDREIAGVTEALPSLAASARGHELKAYEDMIDAIVCAWVGITALGGRALCLGDADAAIWVPAPLADAGE